MKGDRGPNPKAIKAPKEAPRTAREELHLSESEVGVNAHGNIGEVGENGLPLGLDRGRRPEGAELLDGPEPCCTSGGVGGPHSLQGQPPGLLQLNEVVRGGGQKGCIKRE